MPLITPGLHGLVDALTAFNASEEQLTYHAAGSFDIPGKTSTLLTPGIRALRDDLALSSLLVSSISTKR